MRTIDADKLKDEIYDYGMRCGFAWSNLIAIKLEWLMEMIDKQPTCGANEEAGQ